MSIKRKCFFTLLFILFTFKSIAQDNLTKPEIDSLYREDQFYIGVTYNIITEMPNGVSRRGITGGVQMGYLRDMPINKQRNLAIAIGVGLSVDQYGQNLFITNSNNETTFTILESDINFNANRFSMALLEAPIEFRWRSSNPYTYKFWRVYAGFRVGYTFWNKATFKQSGNTISHTNIPEFDNLRLGATLSFGYSTFNFFAYYSINPFFNNEATTTNGQEVDFKTIKLGLIFYIL